MDTNSQNRSADRLGFMEVASEATGTFANCGLLFSKSLKLVLLNVLRQRTYLFETRKLYCRTCWRREGRGCPFFQYVVGAAMYHPTDYTVFYSRLQQYGK